MEPVDPEVLRRVFVTETTEHLDELEGALMELEARPDDAELFQQIFRVAHSVKGTAGSLGFHALADLGHAIEDLLADLTSRSAPVTCAACDLLFEAVDAARRMLPDALAGVDRSPPAARDLLQRLRGESQTAPRAPERAPDLEPARRESDAARDAREARARTVRVEVAKLDRIADLVGEIAVARGRIDERAREIPGPAGAALLDDLERYNRLYAELDEAVRVAMMVPIGPWLKRHSRQVRDVARSHGKMARLAVEGGEVEVDLAVIERLGDPITHLIRNAVDHGIERPDQRRTAGKSPTGTITLSAWYEGGRIALRIADDGAGLSRAKIAAKARARGLVADPEALSVEDLERLVFEPGFSTAPKVSDLSGRGMGLAVVRQHVEALRGSIRIDTAEGAFTSFTLRLPITLATIDGLLVETSGERFMIPIEAVSECLDLPDGVFSPDRPDLVDLRGQALPCVRLRDLLDLGGPAPSRQSVVVVDHDGRAAGIVVDALHGEGRTVIKPLSRLFSGVPGLAGSTILADGRVGLVLDIAALLRRAAERSSLKRMENDRATKEDLTH